MTKWLPVALVGLGLFLWSRMANAAPTPAKVAVDLGLPGTAGGPPLSGMGEPDVQVLGSVTIPTDHESFAKAQAAPVNTIPWRPELPKIS